MSSEWFQYATRVRISCQTLARTRVMEKDLEVYRYLSFDFPDRPIQLSGNHLFLVCRQQRIPFAYCSFLAMLSARSRRELLQSPSMVPLTGT